MKTLIVILFTTCSLFAQKNFEAKHIIQLSDSTLSAGNIYSKAKQWYPTGLVNYKVELKSEEIGKYVVLSVTASYSPKKLTHSCAKGPVTFNIKMDFKDGRSRISFSNFHHHSPTASSRSCNFGTLTDRDEPEDLVSIGKKTHIKMWKNYKAFCEGLVAKISKSYSDGLNSGANDDW